MSQTMTNGDLIKAKEKLKKELNRPSWLRGIGIGKDRLEVRVASREDVMKVPLIVDNVPVNVEVVGDITAR